jgi:hypothetical protein
MKFNTTSYKGFLFKKCTKELDFKVNVFEFAIWQECSLGGTPPSSIVKLWVMPRTSSFSKKFSSIYLVMRTLLFIKTTSILYLVTIAFVLQVEEPYCDAKQYDLKRLRMHLYLLL